MQEKLWSRSGMGEKKLGHERTRIAMVEHISVKNSRIPEYVSLC